MARDREASEPVVYEGRIEPLLKAELPGLTLRLATVSGSGGPSQPWVKDRLRVLSDRLTGSDAVFLRARPVAAAYRAFFRQVGLDPDIARVPVEQATVARLLHGELRARDRVADARLLAAVETGVGLWALDAGGVDQDTLGIRTAQAGERAPGGIAAGQLVVADARAVHAVLFSEVPPAAAPAAGSETIVLFAVGVAGVPAIHLDEAIWQAAEALR